MRKLFVYLTIVLLILTPYAHALDVIPGLKGFGTDTRAAYGAANSPEICIVTSTGEATGNPTWDTTTYNTNVFTGTFAQCLEGLDTLNGETIGTPPNDHEVLANSGKIILFGTSGTIANSGANDTYEVTHPYTTIAGQTAPSPGIWLRNIKFIVTSNDVLVQHITVAAGDELDGYSPQSRNSIMAAYSGAYNIVLDHLSALWGVDTGLTIYGESGENVNNVTVSNSLIAEALDESIHPEGPHSCGLSLQHYTTNVLALNNLMISNDYRNPLVRFGSKVMVNNYCYNHGIGPTTIDLPNGSIDFSAVGNVTESGPDSATGGAGPHCFNLSNDSDESTNWDASQLYFLDNAWIDKDETTYTQSSASDWDSNVIRNQYSDDTSPYKVLTAPIWPTGLTAIASGDVKAYVTANAGSRPGDRDTVTTRIVGDLTNDTGDIIDTITLTSADCTAVDDPMGCCTGIGTSTCDRNDEAGFPSLAVNTTTFTNMPATPHTDDDSDGYTNLEEWLHDFATIVEGDKPEAQNVSPADGATDVGVNVDGSWYHSDYVDDIDWYLYKSACSGVAFGDGGSVTSGDDDSDFTMTFPTLDESSTYCIALKTNYGASQGDAQEFEFTTTNVIPPTTGLTIIEIDSGGAPVVINSGGAPIVVGE